jgi:hypothetical protein
LLALSIVLALALPLAAQDAKKEEPKPEKLLPAGSLAGTLVKGRKGKGKSAEEVWFLRPARGQRVDLQFADDVKVRLAQPPKKYDDKGHILKYTPAELKALKGPGNLPGYAASPEDLRSGQTVAVTLGKRKGAAAGAVVVTAVLVLADAPPGK